MMPLAPGLLSTTTGSPHLRLSLGAMTRARMSIPLPGVYGTTSVIGRLGYEAAVWASAAATGKTTLRAPAQTARDSKIVMIREPRRLKAAPAAHSGRTSSQLHDAGALAHGRGGELGHHAQGKELRGVERFLQGQVAEGEARKD